MWENESPGKRASRKRSTRMPASSALTATFWTVLGAPCPLGKGAFSRCCDRVIPTALPLDPIGVGKGVIPPRPPNRTGGFPAYGSPVGGFLIGNISRPARPCEVRDIPDEETTDWRAVCGK